MARLSPAVQRLIELPDAERRIGPFKLVRQLGRGGFAPGWLAHETYGDAVLRFAAVKLFGVDTVGGPSGTGSGAASAVTGVMHRERIVEEARALCQVEHPNVVRFYSMPSDETGAL